MRNQLEWSVLDVEEDEWQRHIALSVAAASNGFPIAAQVGEAGCAEDGRADAGAARQAWKSIKRRWQAAAIGAATLFLFAGAAGYNLWHRAQAGIAQIKADVAVAVRLENVKGRPFQPFKYLADDVQSVELLGNAAIAQVVISYTLPSGKLAELRQTRFYRQTAAGWQRTGPMPEFWGARSTLDTDHLHFVFGERDRTAVEQVALTAEALYAGLIRVTGQGLTASGVLTVEIVPGLVRGGATFDGGRIQVTSPVLFFPVPAMSSEETFTRLLRDAMCEPMLTAAFRQTRIKPQWRFILESFRCRLLGEAITAQAPAAVAGNASEVSSPPYLRLNDLLDKSTAWDSTASQQTTTITCGENDVYLTVAAPYMAQERVSTASQLVAFIAATYGLDSLARLLEGFGEYDDWETLAPAVFGVSAAELEAAWSGAQ